MPGAVYSPSGGRAVGAPLEVCPLNVGDTWMEPFAGARMENLREASHPGLHRYSPTQGAPGLVDAIVDKLRDRNAQHCDRDSVLVCAGATGALSCAVGTLTSPGEEVLMLAPFWPLIRGIVQTFRATPVEVPFYDRVDSPEAAVDAVRRRITQKSVALYVSTPSNPTGIVLPESWLAALADLARSENLWLLSDEVYEDYVYADAEHVSMAQFAPERTLSVYSFSKAFGMAGNRIGYLVGPRDPIGQAGKISTHTFYCAPTAGQAAAQIALAEGGDWVEQARKQYRKVGKQAAEMLGLPEPQGSTFLFFDATRVVGSRGVGGFLEDCLSDGVALAPGISCGADYGNWVRLCYTSAPPGRVTDAVAKVAERLR
jgi:N-succinyldiaminopimelate aminotransferase